MILPEHLAGKIMLPNPVELIVAYERRTKGGNHIGAN